MSEEAQVTAAEIARLAGVGRAAVSNWRRRYADFPTPVGGSTTSPSFSLRKVEQWLRDQGKLDEVRPVDQLWLALDAALRGRDLTDAVVLAGAALYARRRGPRSKPVVDRAELRGRLPEHLQPLVRVEDGEADERIIETAERVDPSDAASIFEQLYERYVRATSKQLAVTPEPLSGLMVDLAGVESGTLFDPACGTGSVLRSGIIAHPDLEVVGQEIDDGLARLALLRLSFAASEQCPPRVAVGDSLLDDRWPELLADAAVANPPFGQRDWGSDSLAYDARWEYGLPPRGEPELAWTQHLLAHVRPGGRVVVLMPPTVAVRRPGRRIRAELLRRGALRAVIALPAGAAPPAGIPLTLWVLERPHPGASAPADVLFVDAASDYGRKPDIAATSNLTGDVWRDFLAGVETGRPGVATVVPVIDLLDDVVDLTPSRHVRVGPPDVSVADVSGLQETLADVLTGLAALPPAVSDAPPGGTQAVVTVGDLVRSGALTLHAHVGRLDLLYDGPGPAVLTGRDLATGASPSARAGPESGRMHQLRPGEVVVGASGERVRTRVITEDGWLLGPNLYALAPDPSLVDAWFLAGSLRISSNSRFSTGKVGPRIDVRRFEVPRMPLSEQQKLGTAFKRLAILESGLATAERSGHELIRLLTDGLASGTLRLTG
jgi:hypothetical protein